MRILSKELLFSVMVVAVMCTTADVMIRLIVQ